MRKAARDNGKRAAPRADAPLQVAVSTETRRHPGTLVDISRVGAKLSGADFPAEGEGVTFAAGAVQAYGQIVRSAKNECAVEFDMPIAAVEVARLRSLANFVTAVGKR